MRALDKSQSHFDNLLKGEFDGSNIKMYTTTILSELRCLTNRRSTGSVDSVLPHSGRNSYPKL